MIQGIGMSGMVGKTACKSGQIQITGLKNGNLYLSYDYGDTWNVLNSVTGEWSGLAMSADGMYMVGNNGQYIEMSCNYGVTWGRVYSSNTSATPQIAMSASGQYITSTYGTKIIRSTDFGATWGTVATLAINLRGMAMSASGQYQYASQYMGDQFRSSDYGATWTLVSSANAYWYRTSCSFVGDQAVSAIYFSNAYGKTSSYAATWSITTGNPMNGVSMSGDGGYVIYCPYTSTKPTITKPSGSPAINLAVLPVSSYYKYDPCISYDGKHMTIPHSSTSSNGYLYVSHDYGQTWTAKMTDTNRSWGMVATNKFCQDI
jgi:hypothetical protein